MTPAQRTQLKKLLAALQRELAVKGPVKIEPNALGGDVGSAEDEQPLNEMEQAIASSRNKNLTGVLTRVNAALAKLRETPDEYGLCEDCEEEIPFARLKAMPYAEYCVGCQSKVDGPRGRPTRRKLTDYQ